MAIHLFFKNVKIINFPFPKVYPRGLLPFRILYSFVCFHYNISLSFKMNTITPIRAMIIAPPTKIVVI